MITRFVKLVSLIVMLSAACLAQSGTVVSTKPPHGIPLKNAGATPAVQDSTVDNGIEYHGGPVLNKPSGTNVYFIWYGNWSGDSAKRILPDFVQNLGGSPYFNINTTYYDFDKNGQQDPVLNKVNFVASVNDHYSMGTSLSDFNVAQVIANHTGGTFRLTRTESISC